MAFLKLIQPLLRQPVKRRTSTGLSAASSNYYGGLDRIINASALRKSRSRCVHTNNNMTRHPLVAPTDADAQELFRRMDSQPGSLLSKDKKDDITKYTQDWTVRTSTSQNISKKTWPLAFPPSWRMCFAD